MHPAEDHALADVCAMLDRHYLGDRTTLAENAPWQLERSKRGQKL
jgi:hypothetical protein